MTAQRSARQGVRARLAADLFERLARRRQRRALHPTGALFEVTVHSAGRGPGIFARPATYRGLLRFSQGAGLPAPLPDVYGFALRLPDAYGPGRHQDVLLSSSRAADLIRHLPVPTRHPVRAPFSSFLPFRMGSSLRLVLAEVDAGATTTPFPGLGGLVDAAERGGLRFTLLVAGSRGPGSPIGTVDVGRRLPPDDASGLRFNPWNTSPDLRPWGPFMRIRDAAYRGSVRGGRSSGN